jgi:Holliday junction resolvasome RuvABC ATP-dependent DNA helicase subunit
LQEVKNDKYEQEVERMLNEIKKFLQREYKSVTGNGITLRKKGEPKILVQSTSRVRTFVQAYQHYTISGMKNIDQILEPSVASEKEIIKNFLSQVSNKRPQNDTRKKGSNQK